MRKFMKKEIISNWPYIFWFLFYFMMFWLITGATADGFLIVFVIYISSILFSFTPLAEGLWRSVLGLRPPRTEAERERLDSLFADVLDNGMEESPNISRNTRLFIQEEMDINAFAFGRNTLILTKGSVELLSDDCLKGLMAHELGHFAHYDTMVLLITTVGNILFSLLMKILQVIANILLFIVRGKDPTFSMIFKILYKIVVGIHTAILFIGDMILMQVSRKHEFMADEFANKIGFGDELIKVLSHINMVAGAEPEKIIEQLRSTHPPLTKRIEVLERIIKEE